MDDYLFNYLILNFKLYTLNSTLSTLMIGFMLCHTNK